MSGFLGMAPEQGLSAGESIAQRGTQLLSALTAFNASVLSAEWIGEDRDAFIAAWNSLVTSVEGFATLLKVSGDSLAAEAQQQITTSSSGGSVASTMSTASTA